MRKRDYISEAFIAEAIGNGPHTRINESAIRDIRFSNSYARTLSATVRTERHPSAAVVDRSFGEPLNAAD